MTTYGMTTIYPYEHCPGEPLDAEVMRRQRVNVEVQTRSEWVRADIEPDIIELEIEDTYEEVYEMLFCTGCGLQIDQQSITDVVNRAIREQINREDPFEGT